MTITVGVDKLVPLCEAVLLNIVKARQQERKRLWYEFKEGREDYNRRWYNKHKDINKKEFKKWMGMWKNPTYMNCGTEADAKAILKNHQDFKEVTMNLKDYNSLKSWSNVNQC